MMYRNTARVCRAGVVNQAIIANVTAILFVPFASLYGFTYVQLGILAAAGFCAQLAADTFLLFFIDRLSSKKKARRRRRLPFLRGIALLRLSPVLF